MAKDTSYTFTTTDNPTDNPAEIVNGDVDPLTMLPAPGAVEKFQASSSAIIEQAAKLKPVYFMGLAVTPEGSLQIISNAMPAQASVLMLFNLTEHLQNMGLLPKLGLADIADITGSQTIH